MSIAETKQKPKLKWHRFLQIVVLPVGILFNLYNLISYFADLFGINLSWTNHVISDFLKTAGTDVFHLGPFFWPVIYILGSTLITLILLIYAWAGSFRWRRYSYICWLVHLVLNLAAYLISIFTIWDYGFNRGGIYQWMEMYSQMYGQQIRIDPGVITASKVILVVLGLLAVLFTIANFIYYIKRRSLFSTGLQEPYEEEEEEDEEEPAMTEPQVQASMPEPVSAVSETPEPVTQSEESVEKDELYEMLKETEASLVSLNDSQAQDRFSEDGIERTIPVMQSEEDVSETPAQTPVQPEAAPETAINFCPDCGKRIPDPEMRYCIYCGKKIR